MTKSNLVLHAEAELARIPHDTEGLQDMVDKHILHMVEEFSNEGHSGMSAPYCISMLEKLLRYEPLTPLTGEDSEWKEVGEGSEPTWQNRRCSRVFKNADGRTYVHDGIVFESPDGSCYTNRESRVDITFPYTPTRVYVKVDAEGNRLPVEG